MLVISRSDYRSKPSDSKGFWGPKNKAHAPNWEEAQSKCIGQRTLDVDGTVYVDGVTMAVVSDRMIPAWQWLENEEDVALVKQYLGSDDVVMDDNDIACRLGNRQRELVASGYMKEAHLLYLMDCKIMRHQASTEEEFFEWAGCTG